MSIAEDYLVVIESSISRAINEVEKNFLGRVDVSVSLEVFRQCVIENEPSLKRLDSGILFFQFKLKKRVKKIRKILESIQDLMRAYTFEKCSPEELVYRFKHIQYLATK